MQFYKILIVCTLLTACGSGGSNSQSNASTSSPPIIPQQPLGREQFLNVQKRAQPFVVRFTSYDPINTPIKGALAWVYEADKKTVKKIVTSNEFGEADFGIQPENVSFGYSENSLTDKGSVYISTVLDMPNTGTYSIKMDQTLPSCEKNITVHINVTDIPIGVNYISISNSGNYFPEINYETHSAELLASFCQDYITLFGYKLSTIYGYSPYINQNSTQNKFYFGTLNIENLTENGYYTVPINHPSTEYTWKINSLNATSYSAGIASSRSIEAFNEESKSDQNIGVLQSANVNSNDSLTKNMRFVLNAGNKGKICSKTLPFNKNIMNYEATLEDSFIARPQYDTATKKISWQASGAVSPSEVSIRISDFTLRNPSHTWDITTNGSGGSIEIPELPPEISWLADVQNLPINVHAVYNPGVTYDQYMTINNHFDDAMLSVPEFIDGFTYCNFYFDK